MPTTRATPALFATLGMLYFAQGLPAGLLGKSMPALARDAGLSPEWIGLLALPALPWALKFLWAPWVDRWGSGKPNHRKRWILVCVFAVMVVLAITALFPREWLFGPGFVLLVALLFLLNLFSATQDIATDGLATRLLTPDLRGLGNSIQVNGYKIGMILGSGALLILVGRWGWQGTMACMIIALMLVALVAWRFREPPEPVKPRRPVTLRWWRRQLTLFWWRPQMAVAGAALAGVLMMRMSRKLALFGFAGLQAVSFLGWWMVASNPADHWIWPVALFEQFADGLSTVALFVLMMDYCRSGHEGSDYTMQASVQLFAVGAFTLASGFSVAWLGYASHFLLAAILCTAVIMAAFFWQAPIDGNAKKVTP